MSVSANNKINTRPVILKYNKMYTFTYGYINKEV